MAYVYVVQCGFHYKIGYARNVKRRIASMRTASPLPLVLVTSFPSDDAPALEAKLHRRFKRKRVRGEWFKLDKSDLRKLDDLCNEVVTDYASPWRTALRRRHPTVSSFI